MPGSALATGVVGVCAACAIGLAAVAGAAAHAQRISGVADAAALAAADAASGALSGYPCERAQQVAEAMGAHLDECALDGLIATVAVADAHGSLFVRVRARAGPPP